VEFFLEFAAKETEKCYSTVCAVVGAAMLKCSSAILKALKKLSYNFKALAILATSKALACAEIFLRRKRHKALKG
jgi:hypothetical protein